MNYPSRSLICILLFLGLTIDKVDDLIKEAAPRRLKNMVKQVCKIQSKLKPLKNQKKGLLNFLDLMYWLLVWDNRFQLFHYFDEKIDKLASPWKICIYPRYEKNSRLDKLLDKFAADTSSSNKTYYKVYLYDDYNGECGKKLKLYLPAWIVGKTLKLLKERKALDDNKAAQEINLGLDVDAISIF